ncbi:hypothetical protein FB45DRAFT_41185 [Roridomyces roridus]|uniref:Uncharacterized protein n=1 Tax=Roridomyces roridus TaxID=1738132 RepID=A0AAD7BR95_9AGAR|nr:hypothetical protein FB45DRAFT_41185 [Roridomyces roridus]
MSTNGGRYSSWHLAPRFPANIFRFPCRLFHNTPTLRGELVDGRPTPVYALAWVCPYMQFYKNLGGGQLPEVINRNYRNVVTEKWNARPESKYAAPPTVYYGPDGNFYLIAMFNRPCSEHFKHADKLDNPVIESARVAMGVDFDRKLEFTLMWHRWPLNWLHKEVAAYRRQLLVEAALDPDEVRANSDESDSD